MDIHDEPFEGEGRLVANAQQLDTHGTPGWLLQVEFEPGRVVDVLVYASPARGLTPLGKGHEVRVEGTRHPWPADPGDSPEWVVLADTVEVIG